LLVRSASPRAPSLSALHQQHALHHPERHTIRGRLIRAAEGGAPHDHE
jgi:hypothetical protein